MLGSLRIDVSLVQIRISTIRTVSLATQDIREVVVAQLVERSLMILEVRGSTPVIGKILKKTQDIHSSNPNYHWEPWSSG